MSRTPGLGDLTRTLRTARALAPVAASTVRATVEGAVRDALGRPVTGPGGPAALGDAAVPDLPAPAGVEQLARHVVRHALVPADRAAVAELVTDLARTPEWLALHVGWRAGEDGEKPTRLVAGERVTQQIRLMDIPAQARWDVEGAGEEGFALRGTGPMGITLGLWLTLADAPSGTGTTGSTVARLDAALDGGPVRGPVGLTAVRSVETALEESLAALVALLGGTDGAPARLRVGDEPVHHDATGTLLDPRTPVLVGAGQVVIRTPDLADPREPAALAADALRAAAADSGLPDEGRLLLTAADLVYAVPSASWRYDDQAGAVAARVGADRAGTVQTSPFGGDGAQLALNDAAQQVVDGAADVVLVAGAEAGATIAALQRDGRVPDWSRAAPADPAAPGDRPGTPAPDRVIGTDRPANNEAETAVGLGAPVYVYPLLESALRRAAGTDAATHRQRIAGLWSRLSQVASTNPYAWDPTARTPEEIAAPTPDNRMVSEPYTKLMCANLTVDLAAGLVVTSVAAARAAGVPQDKWVFLHGGASATDEWFVSERADLADSPAIAAAAGAALDHAGITAADLGPVDLYSCFPAAVQLGAKALGLPWDDPARPLSVTGGLTSAGGPGNDYGTHAVATMVPLLRAAPEQFGLSTSLGWYATKHAVGVYSATPPRQRFAHLRPAFDRPPARPVATTLEGSGVVEALTRPHDRAGRVEAVVLAVLTDDGTRVLLRHEDPASLDLAARLDLLGRRVHVTDGVLVAEEEPSADDRLVGPGATLPAPPPAPLHTRRHGRHGEVLVVTLDRPHVRNAVDRRMALALERAVDDAEADPGVRVIVLTGAGGTFCSGMDLAGAHRGEVPVTDRRGPLGLTAEPPTKPTLAAVEGDALAGGFELALCADLVVAAEDARFGLPEAKRGLLAAAGGLWRTAVRLPRPVALELALTGDPLPAARLHQLGLVNALVPTGTAHDAALQLAERIAANAPLSVTVGKQVVDAAPGWTAEEGFARQSELASPVVLSDDAREGVAAYAEKRDPVWTGR